MLGQVVHNYRIDRVLSADKGGFGEVYLATHVDSGAEAVVKVLRPAMSANRETVQRFFNEARAAASIHHPGIVQIHNVGYHGERAYLLMERLRGEDLETRLRAGRLPLDRALLFFRQTAGAIAAAHERGIVHRDLKPANLFIVPDPDVVGGERVKVLDFGIAKLASGGTASQTQGVFGTPMYMSPEQCSDTGTVDRRSDLYSLGCILYELACGRPPFGRGGIELIAAHLRDTPPSPRTLVPELPEMLESLILTLLEKDPARRLQSCAALVAAIDGVATSAGISIGPRASMPVPLASALPVTTLQGAVREMQNASTVTRPPPGGRSSISISILGLAVVGLALVAVVVMSALSRRGHATEQAAAIRDAGAPALDAPLVVAPEQIDDASNLAETRAVDAAAPIAARAPIDAAAPAGTRASGDAARAVVSRPIDTAAVGAPDAREHGAKPSPHAPPPRPTIADEPTIPAAEPVVGATGDAAEDDYRAAKAILYSDAPDLALAAAKLHRAIQARPTAKAYFALAVVEYQRNHLADALEAARAVAKQSPSKAEAEKAAALIAKIQANMAR